MTDNLIGDRYVIGPLLGRGGMAEVRRARDTRLERDVAIKLLKADLAGDPIFQERFRREAHSAAGLNHPNIVSVFDTGESFDEASGLMIPYIVMELVQGHTLREILHDGRKIQPAKALELTQAVLDALDYSHRHGIIHRDIKPANVMLTNNGQVKVMDFGIARAVSDTAASMTQTASVIGTPQYLSPEQIRGEPVDRRSDVYSTGCLLYELLTGKPPFEGDSPVSLAYQHVRATPVPPSEVDPLVSTQMDAVVLKALAKNPADRYQTAHDMEDDITRLLAGQKVQAVIPPPVTDDVPTQVMASADRTQVMPSQAAAPKAASRAIDAEEEESNSHLGRIIAIVLGVMLVVALGGVGVIYALNQDRNNPIPPSDTNSGLVAVPLVTTMTQQVAIQALQERNLKAKVVPENGAADNTVGTVTAQLPLDSTLVPPGTVVTIHVNMGPQTFVVPNVMGWQSDAAKTEVAKTFTNTTLAEAPATMIPQGTTDKCSIAVGTIVGMDPAAGASVPATQPVTLYYWTGKITMPLLLQKTRDDAMLILGGTCINPALITIVEQGSAETAPGYVMNQIPSADSIVSADTSVTITIAKAIPPPPPPSDTETGTIETPPPTDTTSPGSTDGTPQNGDVTPTDEATS